MEPGRGKQPQGLAVVAALLAGIIGGGVGVGGGESMEAIGNSFEASMEVLCTEKP